MMKNNDPTSKSIRETRKMAKRAKSATLNLRMYPEQKERWQQAADEVGMSLTDFMIEAMNRVIRRGAYKRWKDEG